MKEQTYSCPCPVHGQILTTKKKKSVRFNSTGKVYTKPIYYCSRCRGYYIFIDEFESDFTAKTIADSGLPIYVRGKYNPTNQKSESQKKKTANKSEKGKNKKKIIRKIEDGKLHTDVIPSGNGMPKNCNKCGGSLCDLNYHVTDLSGKEKILVGKECLKCGAIYYMDLVFSHHQDCFASGSQSDEEKKPVISKEVSELINQYLSTNNNNLIKRMRKELVECKENICPYLKQLLVPGNSERNNKIFYIGMRKSPEMFLRDLCEAYNGDQNELSKKIKPFDFNKGKYYVSAKALVGEINPFPSSILLKLIGNTDFQYSIRNELEKGQVYLSYIKYLSTNYAIISEPWIQEIIISKIRTNEERENYLGYLDLNSTFGINYLNEHTDYVEILHIFQKNILGFEAIKYEELNIYCKEVLSLINGRHVTDDIQTYLKDIVKNPTQVINNAIKNSQYVNWLFALVIAVGEKDILEDIYVIMRDHSINVGNFDNTLAEFGSEIPLTNWLGEIPTADLSRQHILSKKILSMYPLKVNMLAPVVENQNDILIKNVKNMANDLRIDWPDKEKIVQRQNHKISKQSDNEATNDNCKEQNQSQKALQGKEVQEGTYIDDFGMEFDFSELKHLLNL